MKNSITQITEDLIKNIGEIFKESANLNEIEEKINSSTQNLATSLVKLFIERIDSEILQDKKCEKPMATALKGMITEETYCFPTVRLNLSEPTTKKHPEDMNILRI